MDGVKKMVKDKNSLGNLALSVLKFELMGKFFAAAVTITVLGIASAVHKSGFLVNQIFVCLVYFPSFYGVMWRAGSRVPSGGDCDKWKGLKVGFFASLPYFLSTVVLVILRCMQSQSSVLWYRILNIQYLSVFRFAFSSGNAIAQIPWSAIWICIALQFVPMLVTQLAYTLGRCRFSVSEHIMYKNLSNNRK